MARWATLCEIGSVSFTGCRVELINAGAFKSQMVGSMDWANDGTVHPQAINRGLRGIPFGLKMVSAEGTKLSTVFAAIAAIEATNGSIRIKVTDGIFAIDVDSVPDYSQDWFTFSKHSEGWYEDVTLSFVTKQEHP